MGWSHRSLLFVPGDQPRKLEKALITAADAVVADLEDAVAPSARAAARERIAAALAPRADAAPRGPARMVRVNACGRELELDLDAIAELELDAVVLPKATVGSVAALGPDGPPIIAIVETAAGVATAHAIAAAERVVALAIGTVDLSAELGLEPLDGGAELLYARSRLVIDSARAGVRPPFDGAYLRLDDPAGLEREARLARALGMRGKLCIHPSQVETVNDVFGAEFRVDWAVATISAYEAAGGRGAVVLDGEMVDLAVVERARRVLRDAQAAL